MLKVGRPARAAAVSLLASVFLLVTAGPSGAQEDQAPPPDEPIALDPVIVTGLKRQDRAGDLTTSIQVIDGDSLTTSAIDPGAAITRAAPNFYFGGFGQPGLDFVNMRGVGPLGQPANSLDNSIGFSTNGVGTSAFGFPPSLLDVERVEVLRGPQGTLFGRNALGGAVNVVTRPADGTRELSLGSEVGTEGYILGEGKAGGWISKNELAGRLAVRYQRQDGDIPNAIVGGEEGDVAMAAARGTLRFLPSDDLSINMVLGADWDRRRNNYNMLEADSNSPTSGADFTPYASRDRLESTVEVQRRFDGCTLTSLSAFQEFELETDADVGDELLFLAAFGFAPPRGADRSLSEDEERIVSQELRINSPDDQSLSWVAGVNYFRSMYESSRDQDSSFSPFSSGLFDTEIDSQTFAAFGDVTYPLFEGFEVSGGLRVARDHQELSVRYTGKGFPGTVDSFSQKDDTSDTYLTGRVAAAYDWTEGLMTYASVSHGYASGGFERLTINAAVGQETDPFEPSRIWSYEAGIKTSFWRDRVEINISGFFNDISDGQLVAADTSTFPTTFSFVNQDYESYGFEVEGRAALTDDLFVGGGVGFTKSEINNVPDDAVAGIENGNSVPNAPSVTAFADVNYWLLDRLYLTAQYQYVGEREVDIQNTSELDAYHMVNGRLGWDDEGFNLYAFVNNLLDDEPEYFGSTYTPSVHSVAVGPGRVFGLGLRLTF